MTSEDKKLDHDIVIIEAEEEEAFRAEANEKCYSLVRQKNSHEGEHVPLWLITFTDVMALMLTFFVLLYSMSAPKKEEWDQVAQSLSSKFTKQFTKPAFSGSQDVIEIDRITLSKALDLKYLHNLIVEALRKDNVKDVQLFMQDHRLIIAMPSDLLFDSGGVDVKMKGKKVLFSLAGVLSRIKNRVEVLGHTDPEPVTATGGRYESNWELSLLRASSVSAVLQEVGYDGHMVVRGMSSGLYDELPQEGDEKSRMEKSRRVDIVIMDDDGRKKSIMGLGN